MSALEQTDTQAFYEKAMEIANKHELFNGANGIYVTKMDEGYAEGSFKVTRATLNPFGGAHGGALATLADTVAGLAASSYGVSCVTLSSVMNYLRPVKGDAVSCTARVLKAGKNTTVVDAAICDSLGNTVATGTFTFFMNGPMVEEQPPADK